MSRKKANFICLACNVQKPASHFIDRAKPVCFDCSVKSHLEEKSVKADEKPIYAPEPLFDVDVEALRGVDMSKIDPNVLRELAARTLARKKLLSFISRFNPRYTAGWVHRDICRRLERFMRQVEAKKEPRLLLAMPVRHGKSEISSRHFAPWVLGHHPEWEIIAASASQQLALDFSKYILGIMRDPIYKKALFPQTQLNPNSQSSERWDTTLGGAYTAAGVGTMITGRGAHILIVDDLVKDAEAADSATQRDATWEWYLSTALTRLAPGGGVLGVMTCWHDDDWPGRIQQLMASGRGDQFEIVKYPAINEYGDEYLLLDDSIVQIPDGATVPDGARLTRRRNEALHSERYSIDALLRRKDNFIAGGRARWWNALYQQNPTPEEGTYFRKEWLRYFVGQPPSVGVNLYQAWDFAITEKSSSDYTVGCTIAQDAGDNIYVVDIRRFKDSDGIELMRTVVGYAAEFKCLMIGVEDGMIWKALATSFQAACRELKYYPSCEPLTPLSDKKARAQPLRGRLQIGKLLFNKTADWYDEFAKELLRFPTGKHDDQVDALAWAVRMTLTNAAPMPSVAGGQSVEQGLSWRDKLLDSTHSRAHLSHMAS